MAINNDSESLYEFQIQFECPFNCGWWSAKGLPYKEANGSLGGHIKNCELKKLLLSKSNTSTRSSIRSLKLNNQDGSCTTTGENQDEVYDLDNIEPSGYDRYEDEVQEIDPGAAIRKPHSDAQEFATIENQRALGDILEFQKDSEKRLSNENLFQTKSKFLGVQDYIDLAELGETLNISSAQGDLILTVVNKILERHVVKRATKSFNGRSGEVNMLYEDFRWPKKWNTFHNALMKNAETFCKVQKWRFSYDKDYYGEYPMKGPTGIGFNIFELIAEKMLTCNPNEFHGTPLEILNHKNQHLTSSFPTSMKMKKNYENLLARLGGKTTDNEGRPYVLLCIGISKDKAAMNSTRNVSATPVVFQILNLLDKVSEKTVLLGFTPQDDQYSMAMKHAHLKEKLKCSIKKRRDRAIRFSQRDIMNQYLQKLIVDPMLKYEESGLLMQVGTGEGSYQVVAFPDVSHLYADNQDQDDSGGVSSGGKGRKCRICDSEVVCQKPAHVGQKRNHEEMEALSKGLGRFEKSLFKSSLGGKQTRRMNTGENDLEEKGNAYNVIPGENCLYALGKRSYEDHVHAGLHDMLTVDKLHTILKGLILFSVSWTMQSCYALQGINEMYTNIVPSMDAVFVSFPRQQAILPFVINDMPQGISVYFTDYRSNTYQGTGMQSGGLAASRMPGIAFMLLCAIGEGGPESIVPTTVVRPASCTGNLKEWNVSKTMRNAIVSALEIVSFSDRSDGFTEDDFNHLRKLIRINQAHMLVLFEMRNQLMDCSKGIKCNGSDYVKRVFSGHKIHMLSHWVDQMILFGSDGDIFDTQGSEKFHIDCKAVFERSSKNKSSFCHEMARRMNLRMHIARLRRHAAAQARRTATADPGIVESAGVPVSVVSASVASAGDGDHESFDDEDNYAMQSEIWLSRLRQVLLQKKEPQRRTDAGPDDADVRNASAASVLEKSHEFRYVENFKKVELEMVCDGDKGLFKGPGAMLGSNVPQFLHPFLSMSIFTEILLHEFNVNKQSRFGECMNSWAADIKTKNDQPRYRMELLQGIRCSGIIEFYIPSFHIYCDSKVPHNRMAHIENQSFYQKFSWVEVNFADEVAIVRVLAIVRISPTTVTRDAHGHVPLGEVRLIVLKIRKCPTGELYEYSFTPRRDGALGGLEIHTIELSSVIRPACVIPVFTKSSVSSPQETYSHNLRQTYKSFRFNFIMVHSIRNFDVRNSYTGRDTSADESHRNIIINAPLNLSDGQIAAIETQINEGQVSLDDGGFEDDYVESEYF